MVLGFAWGMGAWWILVPILGLVTLAAWLDKADRTAPREDRPGNTGISGPARLRFRLWHAAQYLQLALIASVFVLPAAGAGKAVGTVIAPCMAIALAAGALFRFGFVRSCRRDERAAAGRRQQKELVRGDPCNPK
jgi:hypothetical protein